MTTAYQILNMLRYPCSLLRNPSHMSLFPQVKMLTRYLCQVCIFPITVKSPESRWGRYFPPVQTSPGAHSASCKMGTGSFPGVKCCWGCAADHSPPSSATVMEEQSYTSTHPLGHNTPVTGKLYFLVKSPFSMSLKVNVSCLTVHNCGT